MIERQEDYGRLIAPVEDRMMRAVWRVLRDPGDAEDAFQEALLTIWKRWDRVRIHPNPEALVLQICIHAAHDVLRRRLRRAPAAFPEEIADGATTAVQSIADAQQAAQVLAAIGMLPKNQARAILMHAVEEVPYSEIASAMDCKESTVRKHVERARAKLRGLLAHLIPAAGKEEARRARS